MATYRNPETNAGDPEQNPAHPGGPLRQMSKPSTETGGRERKGTCCVRVKTSLEKEAGKSSPGSHRFDHADVATSINSKVARRPCQDSILSHPFTLPTHQPISPSATQAGPNRRASFRPAWQGPAWRNVASSAKNEVKVLQLPLLWQPSSPIMKIMKSFEIYEAE